MKNFKLSKFEEDEDTVDQTAGNGNAMEQA